MSAQAELEHLQIAVDDARLHADFIKNMVLQLKQGDKLFLVPTTYEAPKSEERTIEVAGQCAGCGEPLATASVVGFYMLACKHKYHPLCFASLIASSMFCIASGCKEIIPDHTRSLLLGEPRMIVKQESKLSFIVFECFHCH